MDVPGVAEATVVGIPDPRWGERPIAFIVRSTGPAVTEALLRQAVSERAQTGAISRYAIPDAIHFCEVLPRTSIGKVDKKALRDTAIASASLPTGDTPRRGDPDRQRRDPGGAAVAARPDRA
uniref:AMP-binding enzyme n=1 Tax=Sphingobium sp. HT1-2 TaxID=3111640 RepID=UPI003C2FFA49